MSKISIIQQYQQEYLYDKDRRHSIFKIPVFRLVAEVIHAQSAPQCTAQKGERKQRSLRDAPGTPDGSFFVYTHNDEPKQIDDQKISHEKHF